MKAMGKLKKETKEKMSKAKAGKNNPNSKLTKEDGQKIVSEYYGGLDGKRKRQKELAEIYDVSVSTISKVVNLEHWTTRDDF